MNIIILITIILTVSLAVSAQRIALTKDMFDCGNPNSESQLIPEYKAKVIEIIDGNTVRVKIKEKAKRIFRVDLAAVDTDENDAQAKQILIDEVLNKDIYLSGNTREKDFMFGVIVTQNKNGIGEVNRYFLENGIAKYKNPDYGYSTSNYVLCVYSKFEEKAREAKLGIWAK